MASRLKRIHTQNDYNQAPAEMERLCGPRSGTPDGERLDQLVTLIDAYEACRRPIDTPNRPAIPAARRTRR